MATSVKSALTRCMATADCLIHFEATVNAPGAPTPTLSACKIWRDHFNSLWQTVKAAYDICSDCIVAAGESVEDTNSLLNSKYYQTYSTYEIFAAQLMEQIQKWSSQIPQAPVTPSQYSTSYGCWLPPIDTEVWRLSSLADFPGPFHGNIHRQSESNARWKITPLKFKNKWRSSLHSFKIPTHL